MKSRAVTYMKFERVFFLIVAAKFAKDHAFYGFSHHFSPLTTYLLIPQQFSAGYPKLACEIAFLP